VSKGRNEEILVGLIAYGDHFFDFSRYQRFFACALFMLMYNQGKNFRLRYLASSYAPIGPGKLPLWNACVTMYGISSNRTHFEFSLLGRTHFSPWVSD
jgi:hypothetical protein